MPAGFTLKSAVTIDCVDKIFPVPFLTALDKGKGLAYWFLHFTEP